MNTNSLTTESVSKLFFRHLIPAIMGTMVTSIYILADTIIIGKGIGIDAMAALNIMLPELVTLLIAFCFMRNTRKESSL